MKTNFRTSGWCSTQPKKIPLYRAAINSCCCCPCGLEAKGVQPFFPASNRHPQQVRCLLHIAPSPQARARSPPNDQRSLPTAVLVTVPNSQTKLSLCCIFSLSMNFGALLLLLLMPRFHLTRISWRAAHLLLQGGRS